MFESKYSVIDIANYFIELASKEESEKIQLLSNLKLQKLCYIAHGVYLAYTEEPLFKEKVEAWPFGPVIPKLYEDDYIKKCNSPCKMDYIKGANEIKNQDMKDVIQAVWEKYKDFQPFELVSLTHLVDTPWFDTYNFKRSNVIDNNDTKAYYKRILELNE